MRHQVRLIADVNIYLTFATTHNCVAYAMDSASMNKTTDYLAGPKNR